jgi:hypothetical protein
LIHQTQTCSELSEAAVQAVDPSRDLREDAVILRRTSLRVRICDAF